jgi:hypothetical protein
MQVDLVDTLTCNLHVGGTESYDLRQIERTIFMPSFEHF